MVDILGELNNLMKIIKNNRWGKIIDWGIRWLPSVFLRTHYLDGKKIRLQKWITQKQWDKINEHVDDLIKNLKFD